MKISKVSEEKRKVIRDMVCKESILTEITTTSLNPYVFDHTVWDRLFKNVCYYDFFKGLRFVIPPAEAAKFFDIIESEFNKLEEERDKDVEREVKTWKEKVTFVTDPALNGLNMLSITIYNSDGIRITHSVER